MYRLLVATVICFVSMSMTHADRSLQKQYLPVDSDNDGVLDEADQCYKTPEGVQVDNRGCPRLAIEFATINLNINFDFDSAVVKPEYFSEIEQLAIFLNQYPLSRVTLEAHTDSDGSNLYNKNLSQRRAQSVAQVLVNRFRIEALRVTAIGFGEEKPLVANDSEKNKAKNRRVVAAIKSLKNTQ